MLNKKQQKCQQPAKHNIVARCHLMRKSFTTSLMTWQAVESTLITGVLGVDNDVDFWVCRSACFIEFIGLFVGWFGLCLFVCGCLLVCLVWVCLLVCWCGCIWRCCLPVCTCSTLIALGWCLKLMSLMQQSMPTIVMQLKKVGRDTNHISCCNSPSQFWDINLCHKKINDKKRKHDIKNVKLSSYRGMLPDSKDQLMSYASPPEVEKTMRLSDGFLSNDESHLQYLQRERGEMGGLSVQNVPSFANPSNSQHYKQVGLFSIFALFPKVLLCII